MKPGEGWGSWCGALWVRTLSAEDGGGRWTEAMHQSQTEMSFRWTECESEAATEQRVTSEICICWQPQCDVSGRPCLRGWRGGGGALAQKLLLTLKVPLTHRLTLKLCLIPLQVRQREPSTGGRNYMKIKIRGQ